MPQNLQMTPRIFNERPFRPILPRDLAPLAAVVIREFRVAGDAAVDFGDVEFVGQAAVVFMSVGKMPALQFPHLVGSSAGGILVAAPGKSRRLYSCDAKPIES
jgi:hypothetical protein